MLAPASKLSCAHCGALNGETARFCNHCGKDLTAPPAATPQPPPASAAQRKVCPGCHKVNQATAGFCFSCGVRLPAAAAVPAFGEPAGFIVRAGATIVDGGVLWLLETLILARLGMTMEIPEHATSEQRAAAMMGLALGLLINLVYSTVMVGAVGATVGKLIFGLRIIRHSDGRRPAYGVCMMRWFAQLFSLIPLGAGFLWVGLSPLKRAWHDYLCDTRVVYARAR